LAGPPSGEVSERQALLALARGQTAPPAGREAAASEEVAVKSQIIGQQEVDKAIAAIQDDLDVAIERATSEDGRKAAKMLRESVVGISTGWKSAAAAKQIDGFANTFDQLVERYAADGLQLRVNAEDLVSRGVRSTLIAIGASVAIALLITWIFTLTIVPAVRRAAKFAEEIAEGRLNNVILRPEQHRRPAPADWDWFPR
jgi:hypothetical protein